MQFNHFVRTNLFEWFLPALGLKRSCSFQAEDCLWVCLNFWPLGEEWTVLFHPENLICARTLCHRVTFPLTIFLFQEGMFYSITSCSVVFLPILDLDIAVGCCERKRIGE